jgi:hypothetical protein
MRLTGRAVATSVRAFGARALVAAALVTAVAIAAGSARGDDPLAWSAVIPGLAAGCDPTNPISARAGVSSASAPSSAR